MSAWFPCQHPEQVRVAQSAAMVPQYRSNAGFILCMMALGLAAQIAHGFGWPALLWQAAMGVLAYKAVANWYRLSTRPPTIYISGRQVRKLVASAAVCGCCWSLGMLVWTLRAPPHYALIAVAVSLTIVMHAVAAGYFMPWAVVGLSAPMFAAALVICITTLDTPVAAACIVLVALHALAAFRLLRRNWSRFSGSIDTDVEKERLAAMLHEQKEIAERAVQLKSSFLASASHDLRQPMHAISLYLDGLAAADVPPRVREAIADARVCAHDMNDMFRSLLDISRLDAQQAVPTLSAFSIAGVMSRVEKEFTPLAVSRDVRLKVRPCAEHVYSDPVMVERIALNFVSNAVRHTPGGGRVLVACRVHGRLLRLAVYDTGRGIPEADQKVIFDEFHRLDPSRPSDHTGGLGLGLAIVRRLVQALRLPLTLRSTPGRGSMFAVDLPLMHVSRSRAQPVAAEPTLAGRLMVVVDDEPSILQAASFILEAAGCDVVAARSGSELMMSLASTTRVPDVIICDYELNDESKGTDVIRRVREEFNTDIPALLVTGNTAGGLAEKSAKELGVPVLYKPLEAAGLRSSLEELLTTEER